MSPEPESDLDERLIAAHESGNSDALVGLYRQAGEAAEAAGDIDRACFFYVHAYVFALEAGHEDAGLIRASLRRHDREK